MTDFLTRLAQRTLGLASVVQPRIASRYGSPAEGIMPPPPPDQFAVAKPATEALPVPMPPMAPPVRPADRESPPPRHTHLIPAGPFSPTVPPFDGETSDSATTNTAWISPAETISTDSLEYSRNPSETLAASLPSASSANSSNYPATRMALPLQQNLEHRAIAPANQPTRSTEVPPLSSASGFQADPPSLHPSLPPTEQMSQAPSIQLPLVPPAVANLADLTSVNPQKTGIESSTLASKTPSGFTTTQSPFPHLSSLKAELSSLSEPTIEIRIGRIEVRETQTSASKPRPKSTPSTPALSLSDYLNQRNGGKP